MLRLHFEQARKSSALPELLDNRKHHHYETRNNDGPTRPAQLPPLFKHIGYDQEDPNLSDQKTKTPPSGNARRRDCRHLRTVFGSRKKQGFNFHVSEQLDAFELRFGRKRADLRREGARQRRHLEEQISQEDGQRQRQ